MGRLRKADRSADALARSRGRGLLAAASLLSLIAVQPAMAGQIVWNKGDAAIWAMNDDGSNQRQLTGVPPGMSPDGVQAPGTVPNSSTVLFSARTAQYTTLF